MADDTPAATLMWRLTPWDGLVHAFRPEDIGDVTAEALCEHSALADHLVDHDGPRCHACVLLQGNAGWGKPPRFVSGADGAKLAVVLRSAQWALDDVAHDLPAGQCTSEQLRHLAETLARLSHALRAASGEVQGEGEEGMAAS